MHVVDVLGGYVLVDCSLVPLYSRATWSANTGVTRATSEERARVTKNSARDSGLCRFRIIAGGQLRRIGVNQMSTSREA